MKIAILSRSGAIYSTARLVEEGRARGHKVYVIDPLRCNLLMEKNSPLLQYDKTRIENIDAIVPRIGSSITFYGSAVIRQFEMMNVFTVVNSNALLRSRDKLRSMQLMSRESIDMPKTFFTNMTSNLEVEDMIDAVGGVPIILKVLEGTQGVGVMLLETKNAAISVIQAMNSLHAKVMVQEYIQEAKGADLRVLVINNKIVGAMIREGKDGEFRSNLHRGGSATVVELTPEEERVALNACEAIGLQVAGVDMLRSDRGPLVLEVNSSPGLEGIENATGNNIAKEIILYAEEGVRLQNKAQINRANG